MLLELVRVNVLGPSNLTLPTGTTLFRNSVGSIITLPLFLLSVKLNFYFQVTSEFV